MKNNYQPPLTLREWINDIPGGELYQFSLLNNSTVCSSTGRYSHSSGSASCSWAEFIEGSLNDQVKRTMGEPILNEALNYLKQHSANAR